VVLALLPATSFAVWASGLSGLLVVSIAVAACLATESILCRLRGTRSTVDDWSVAITGLLFALTLPPALPLWMVVVGSVISVVLGKGLFGGLGVNPFNPALVGRAFLQAAFPSAMTTWTPPFAPDRFTVLPASTLTAPFTRPAADVVTGATPLALWKFEGQMTDAGQLFLGSRGGSLGETSSLLLLLGGLYLLARNMMSWRIPVAVLGTVFFGTALLHGIAPDRYPTATFMLFSGGLMLGALFMATDMVTSPTTPGGSLAFGAIIGLLTIVIRVWGGMPEGVMYAILLANALVPHLDLWFGPRVYGTRRVHR
jgi:electron transport complex protein RnfD